MALLWHRIITQSCCGCGKPVAALSDVVGPQATNPAARAQVMYMSLKKLRPSVPAEMPEDYRELMDRCWAFSPGVRPSFQVLGLPHEVCASGLTSFALWATSLRASFACTDRQTAMLHSSSPVYKPLLHKRFRQTHGRAAQEVLACLREMYARHRGQTLPTSHSMDEPGSGGDASPGPGDACFATSPMRSMTA